MESELKQDLRQRMAEQVMECPTPSRRQTTEDAGELGDEIGHIVSYVYCAMM
jgi:hypothetical protein